MSRAWKTLAEPSIAEWNMVFKRLSLVYCVKIDRNCNFVGLLHHPLGL